MSEFKPGDYISDNSSGESVHAVVMAKRKSGELELLWIPEHGCQVVLWLSGCGSGVSPGSG